jgi:hypothetical protein
LDEVAPWLPPVILLSPFTNSRHTREGIQYAAALAI